jgi:hypothetical protein
MKNNLNILTELDFKILKEYSLLKYKLVPEDPNTTKVIFIHPECPACKRTIENFNEDEKKVGWVDISNSTLLAIHFNIKKVPTTITF